MTKKETVENNEILAKTLGNEFQWMFNGGLKKQLRLFRKTSAGITKNESPEEFEQVKSFFKNLLEKSEEVLKEMIDNPDTIFKSEKGTPVDIESFKQNVELLRSTLAENVKKEEVVETETIQTEMNLDSKPIKESSIVDAEEIESKETVIEEKKNEEKQTKTAKVTAVKKKKVVKKKKNEEPEKKTTEGDDMVKDVEVEVGKKVKSFNSLSELKAEDLNIEKEPELSTYDSWSLLLSEDITKRGDFMKEHANIVKDLITKIKEKKEKETTENYNNFIKNHIENLNKLISKIQSYGIDPVKGESVEKRAVFLNTLKNDLYQIKNIDKYLEEKAENEKIDIEKEKTQDILEKLSNYQSIKNEIKSFIEKLDGKRTKKLKNSVIEFINTNKEKISILISHIHKEGVKGDAKKLGELKNNLELLKKLEIYLNDKTKKPEINNEANDSKKDDELIEQKNPEQAPEQNINNVKRMIILSERTSAFKKINLSEEFDFRDIGILDTYPDLKKDFLSAIEEYNQSIDNNAEGKEKFDLFNKVNDLREEWLLKKSEFIRGLPEKDVKTKPKHTPKMNMNEDSDIPKKYAFATTETRRPPLSRSIPLTETAPVTTETVGAEPETEAEEIEDGFKDNRVEMEDIFTLDNGKDYESILEDKNFDEWFKKTYEMLKSIGKNTIHEVKDIEVWYKKYQEALPFQEKLKEILSDVEKGDVDVVQKMMSKKKIDVLLFELYMDKNNIKEEIENIYNIYQQNKYNAEQIKKIESIFKAKEEIKKEKSKSILKDLTYKDVGSLLELEESEQLIEENMSDLYHFLKDMSENYDFYSSGVKAENQDSERIDILRRSILSSNKEGGKIGGVKRFFTKLVPNFLTKVNSEDINIFSPRIKELRKLNLVDRKDGNKTRTLKNKESMNNLLNLLGSKTGILIKMIQNPDDKDFVRNNFGSLNIDEENALNAFKSMYKVFSETKYMSKEAKDRANKIFEREDDLLKEDIDSPKPVHELLVDVDTKDEVEALRKAAEYEVFSGDLNNINIDIDKLLKKPKIENISEIKSLADRLNRIITNINKTGVEVDLLKIKKAELKLLELEIKYIDKNNFKELSNLSKSYDILLKSTETTNSKKKEYLTEFLKSLNAQKDSRKNTSLQNKILGGIIKKYQDILNSL